MQLPEAVQSQITTLLEKVRADANHSLTSKERYTLYHSFNLSKGFKGKEETNPSLGDSAVCWLGYLTVQHILTVWDNYDFSNTFGVETTPHQILTTLQELLQNKISREDAEIKFDNEFYYGYNIGLSIHYGPISVYNASMSALGVSLYGIGEPREEEIFPDDKVVLVYGDFASEAVKAYSVIDNLKPGDWEKEFYDYQIENISKIDLNKHQEAFDVFLGPTTSNDSLNDTPASFISSNSSESFYFDAQKRLEFWEWWLTEAIPQAWQLAQENYQP